MFDKNEKHLKCKDCMFYSGIQCHGHGLFFGSCEYSEYIHKIIKQKNINDDINNNLNFICDDNDICHFIDKGGDH